jgi:hypothetical protein
MVCYRNPEFTYQKGVSEHILRAKYSADPKIFYDDAG